MKNPILIQGAMEMETEILRKELTEVEEIQIGTHIYYQGKRKGYPVIISETKIGLVDAAIATSLAIHHFHPCCILNQGVAGSHKENIHRGDIILGEQAVHIHSFITGIRGKGEGSDPFDWKFDTRARKIYHADKELLKLAKEIPFEGNIWTGIIGSGNIFNREVDRIDWIQKQKNTLCEDNETVSIYTVCEEFQVPCIGIRIIGNNEKTATKEDGGTATRINDGVQIITREYDEKPAYQVQKFVIALVDTWIERKKNDKSI